MASQVVLLQTGLVKVLFAAAVKDAGQRLPISTLRLVNLNVLLEVGPARERFVANLTFERFLSSVNPLVSD